MKLLALASIVLMAAGNGDVPSTLTFDDALALARTKSATSTSSPLLAEIAALRRSRLPAVRAEVTGNSSRTLDLFSEGPLEVRYASSVLAFDYPIWDGGATNARIGSIQAKLRRIGSQNEMDDARFMQLLDVFGELYLAQRQSEAVRPLYEQLSADAERSAKLLASGEISNLMATDRREVALAFASRLLELEARRVDAAARLRLLTGLEAEPRLVLDLSEPSTIPAVSEHVGDDYVKATSVAVEESKARLTAVETSNGFRAMLSGFAGVGTAESQFRKERSDGSFGVYGLRVYLSYPLFGGTTAIAVAEAKAGLAESTAARDAAIGAARARASEYRLQEETSSRRISLLQQSVEAGKEREEALRRLVAAGMRSESDLGQAQAERVRREADLLAVEIERWKVARLLARMNAAGDPGKP